MSAAAAPKRVTKRALWFVLATVLVDMIGLGLIIPVVPAILRELTHTDTTQAARWGGILFFAYAAMQFVCSPILGGLSDAYGRRPLLLLSVVGLGIDNALTALSPSVWWLLAGRTLAGACGASHATASAYIADVTEPEERGRAFGLVGAAFGVGFVLGPALGGLLGGYGPRVPFFVAAGLSLANALYGLLVLPESLPEEARRPFSLRRANPVGSLLAMRGAAIPSAMVAALFVYLLAGTVYPSVWTFYTMDRYGWDERLVGASLAAYGIVGSVVQAGLVGVIVAKLGERRAAFLALAVDAVVLAGLGLATHGWMVFALVVVGAPSGVAYPALKAILSQAVPTNQQGMIQGAAGSLEGIASILGPIVMTTLFSVLGAKDAALRIPGAPFFCAAALAFAAALLVSASRKASA